MKKSGRNKSCHANDATRTFKKRMKDEDELLMIA